MTTGTRSLVDPDLLPLLDRLDPPEILNDDTLEAARARRVPPPMQRDTLSVTTEVQQAPGLADDPDVRVLVSRPSAPAPSPRPAILHIHGGGFVMGTPEAMLPLLRRWAHELDCVVISVDYRLAPEAAFPAPLDDCYAALKWTADNAETLGIDPARIGVAGESAGGGLAAGLTLLVRQRGGPTLAFQNLQYPMLDDRTVTATSPNPVTGEFLWTREKNHFGWRCYLGQEPGGTALSPFAAPSRANSLADLPPAYIGVGTLDLFLDEDLDYALRLIRARVPVELDVFPGAFHAFELQAGAAITKRSMNRRIEAMRQAMYP
ncbi:arylesterase [Acetobacter estunensis NRIC 0472]|uniref:Alpha/beta hydrolase fold domain-containing protein n=1 Tax=Acetobacter estunensis TaxID=104097 RepID=A0A967EIH6_9PROT|nr:alpha/beta hydrolase [Acetobacter estunensis]NHO53244.1 alpha/beta hydrolase fold domain-containing protein [Acetobacter estunensis]GBQ23708.1 arylesterase [Acetobacter estunensis NRIC 0472]